MKMTLNLMSALLFMTLNVYNTTTTDDFKTSKIALIEFENETIDFGTIEQYADGNRIAKFTNKGDIPLVIAAVKPTCGCTVADYTKEPIQPGESGEIKIKYDTKRLGVFNKSIRVYSNAEGNYKLLKIKGKVVAKN